MQMHYIFKYHLEYIWCVFINVLSVIYKLAIAEVICFFILASWYILNIDFFSSVTYTDYIASGRYTILFN